MAVCQHIARTIDAEWNPAKVGLMIAGLEVPHLHVHLVPIWEVRDLDFARAQPGDRDELEKVGSRLRRALVAGGLDPGVR
jgi:diadenosine tetraphosphate (Ap4A) HIT family hydrolase